MGLIQSDEAGEIRWFEANGESRTVEARRGSSRSLMRANFHELLSDQELADLIAYLRGQESREIRGETPPGAYRRGGVDARQESAKLLHLLTPQRAAVAELADALG